MSHIPLISAPHSVEGLEHDVSALAPHIDALDFEDGQFITKLSDYSTRLKTIEQAAIDVDAVAGKALLAQIRLTRSLLTTKLDGQIYSIQTCLNGMLMVSPDRIKVAQCFIQLVRSYFAIDDLTEKQRDNLLVLQRRINDILVPRTNTPFKPFHASAPIPASRRGNPLKMVTKSYKFLHARIDGITHQRADAAKPQDQQKWLTFPKVPDKAPIPYRLTSFIVENPNSRVFKAIDLRNGDKVVVKFCGYSKVYTVERNMLKRVLSLRVPFTIRLRSAFPIRLPQKFMDIEPGNDVGVLTTRMIDSPDLAKRIAANPLSMDELRILAFQLLIAFDHLYRANIIHGDLKPENLFLLRNQLLKIIDFGLGRIVGQHDFSEISSRWWQAPEVTIGLIDQQGIGNWALADTWSIGCVLAEGYLRKPLFPSDDYHHQLLMINVLLHHQFTTEQIESSSDGMRYFEKTAPQGQYCLKRHTNPNLNSQIFQQKIHGPTSLDALILKYHANEPEMLRREFSDFIGMMLRFNDRWTPHKLLDHSFMKSHCIFELVIDRAYKKKSATELFTFRPDLVIAIQDAYDDEDDAKGYVTIQRPRMSLFEISLSAAPTHCMQSFRYTPHEVRIVLMDGSKKEVSAAFQLTSGSKIHLSPSEVQIFPSSRYSMEIQTPLQMALPFAQVQIPSQVPKRNRNATHATTSKGTFQPPRNIARANKNPPTAPMITASSMEFGSKPLILPKATQIAASATSAVVPARVRLKPSLKQLLQEIHDEIERLEKTAESPERNQKIHDLFNSKVERQVKLAIYERLGSQLVSGKDNQINEGRKIFNADLQALKSAVRTLSSSLNLASVVQ